MTFPTVKTNPYGIKKSRRREKHLWHGSWWKQLCEQAESDRNLGRDQLRMISPACLEMIAEFNRRLS